MRVSASGKHNIERALEFGWRPDTRCGACEYVRQRKQVSKRKRKEKVAP